MATLNNPNLTAEELSVIADYEKSGPENVQEHYDMLLDTGIAVSHQSVSSKSAGIGLQKHRRKSSRPVQYRPLGSLGTTTQNALQTNPRNGNQNASPQSQQEEEQPSEEVMPLDPITAAIDLRGIEDINQRIRSQLQEATAVADSEHQPCPFCCYVFSSVAFLIRHLKYRHGINLEMQVGMPQDPSRKLPNSLQPPALGKNSLDGPYPVPGSNPSSDTSEEQSSGDTQETVNPPHVDNPQALFDPQLDHSDRISAVNEAEIEGQKPPDDVMTLQRKDQFMGPMLNQGAEQAAQPTIVCNQCTRAFSNQEAMERHQRVHNVEKSYQCDHCNKLFQNPSSLKKHTKLHTDGKVYVCEICYKSFAAAAYLKTHMRLHTKQKPFVCKHCGKAFAASGTLISHERIHINDKPYGCEFCGKRFRQGSHLNRHKIIHTNVKPHVCSKCDRAFADIANLRRHERIHSQDNSNVCTECGKSFINLSSLKKHERLHTNEKPYVCRHCSKPFASSGNLISHERTHTNERPYICKECGKAFTQSSHLKAHMGTHSTDTLYVCKHCGRGFTQRSTLCVHERIHLNKKPYICKFCTRAFTQSSTLKAHIRTHTKERAHACKVCGKAFSARGNLKSHELIHTNEKPFKCKACPKAFKQGSTLRAHERTHTKERPYVCRECGKAFADGSNLKAHTIRIHNRDATLSLSMQQVNDFLMVKPESVDDTLNPDESGSLVATDLHTQEQHSKAPVGIKIKKTLDGLTSALRKKEESFPLGNASDQEVTENTLPFSIDTTSTQETNVLDLSGKPDKMSTRTISRASSKSRTKKIYQHSFSSSSSSSSSEFRKKKRNHLQTVRLNGNSLIDCDNDPVCSSSRRQCSDQDRPDENLELLLEDAVSDISPNCRPNRTHLDLQEHIYPGAIDTPKVKTETLEESFRLYDGECPNERPVDYEGFLSFENHNNQEMTGHQDLAVKGSSQCGTSVDRLGHLEGRDRILEDLEMSRILPLNYM